MKTFSDKSQREATLQKGASPDGRIRLSERDFALFAAALKDPTPPNTRLKAAAQEYKTVRRERPELNW